MKKFCFFICCVCFFQIHLSALANPTKYARVKINLNTVSIARLAELGFALEGTTRQNSNFYTGAFSQLDIAKLKRYNIEHTVLIKDLSHFYRERNKLDSIQFEKTGKKLKKVLDSLVHYKEGSMGGFLTLDEAYNDIDSMQLLFPDLISVKKEIGLSVEDRPLYIIKISDNPNVDENEPELFLNALHHAREPIGLQQMVYYMWYLLEKYSEDSEIKYFVDNLEFYFLPCVNPDGYERNRLTDPGGGGMWRKNRVINGDGSFGVDLNRTYSVGWGLSSGSSNNPDDETYRGPEAFSQPETRALRDFMLERNIIMTLNYHAYANGLIHPYSYRDNHFPEEINFFRKLGNDLARENNFMVGSTSEILDYFMSGDANDWQHDATGSFSFLPEVGSQDDGFWPPRSRIPDLIDAALSMNLTMARYALPPVVKNLHSDSLVSPFSFRIDYKADGLPDTAELVFKSLENQLTINSQPLSYVFNSLSDTYTDSIEIEFDGSSLQDQQEVKIELTTRYHKFQQVDTLILTYFKPVLSVNPSRNASSWSMNFYPDYAELLYSLPRGTDDATLTVSDVKGQMMARYKLNPSKMSLWLDTRRWGESLYYFTVANANGIFIQFKAVNLN